LNELKEIWPTVADRATVIHHGVERLSLNIVACSRSQPFFLFVGRRGLYKGFSLALRALAAANLPEHELVCVGGGDFTHSEKREIAQLGLQKRVHRAGSTDEELAGLYEGANALIYPSSYEGFGLPLLEAMIHGCVALTRPETSLPEVGGDAALYAQDSVEEWSTLLRTVALTPAIAERQRQRGLARAAEFTWERSARCHAEIYGSLAH
jgi:glycosyltransferase involved in cell wall biosynthesis